MKLPGLNTTRGELKMLESFGRTRYRNRTLKYNAKLIKYRGTIFRLENSKLVCGDQVFVQDPQNCIFATQDFRDLRILGMGEIVGASGPFMIFRRRLQYHIYSNGIVISVHFYLENDRLLYKPATSSREGEVADIVERSLIYKGYFVVQSERNVLFINLSDSTDVQFRFPGTISKMERIMIGRVEHVLVRYALGTKDTECDALFYYDQIIVQNLKITRCRGQYMAEAVQSLGIEGISQCSKRSRLDGCVSGLQFHTESIHISKKMGDAGLCTGCSKGASAGSSDRKTQDSSKACQDIRNPFLAELVTSHHVGTFYEPDNQSNTVASKQDCAQNPSEWAVDGFRILGDLSPLEEQLFRYLTLEERVLLLRSRAEGKSYDIVTRLLNKIIHRFESIESLFTETNIERHGCTLSALRIHDFRTFFYQSPDFDAVVKNRSLLFRQPFTNEEMEFLDRKYSRIFRFDPAVRKSDNLAYSIIRYEICNKEHPASREHVLSSMLDAKKSFSRLFKSYFGDIRIQDVVQFMLENSIAIQTDVGDVANSRLSAFLLRSHSNIGCFIMNLGGVYCDGYFKDVPKINGNRVDDKVSQDLLFLNGACLSAFYKKSNMGVHYDLGTAFGNGLIRGLSDEDTRKYLKMMEDANEKTMRHLLLVISTRSTNGCSRRSVNINSILKAQAESQDMDLRRAALCALAIYNSNTNDRCVLEILTNECKRFGPTSLEKNNCFYDRSYRMLSALCCGLVASKPMSVALEDSFCELLINGLSSVGSGCSRELFYRTDDCRPQEVFYSQLFELTCDFSTPVGLIVQDLSLEGSRSMVEIFRISAKIFYVSLKSLRDQTGGHVEDWLFDLAERTEEALEKNQNLQIMFSTVLAALSIVKSGTCDLKLLRILRRQILKTKDLKHMEDYEFFDHAVKDRVLLKGCDYGCMQMYKICVGVVCSNFGMSKARADIKQLIVTFLVDNNLPLRFSSLDILRMLVTKSFEPNQEVLESLKKHAVEINIRNKRKHLRKLLKSRFPGLNILDKKVVVDILSDYYENYHLAKRDQTIFDLRILANLVSICK